MSPSDGQDRIASKERERKEEKARHVGGGGKEEKQNGWAFAHEPRSQKEREAERKTHKETEMDES